MYVGVCVCILSACVAAGGSSKQWLIGKLEIIELSNIRVLCVHVLLSAWDWKNTWRRFWDLHGFCIFFDSVRIILKFISDGAKWHPVGLTLQQFDLLLSKSLCDPNCMYSTSMMRPVPAPHRLNNFLLNLFIKGYREGRGKTEQLLLCHNPYVTGLWPLFSGTWETSDIIVPTVQHSSLTHLLNFSIKGTLSIKLLSVSFWVAVISSVTILI